MGDPWAPEGGLGTPLWTMVGSLLGPWGPLGRPMGTSGGPMVTSRGPRDPLVDHGGVALGSFGEPLGDPWGPQGGEKEPKGSHKGAPERVPEKDPKKVPFWTPPWRGSGELSLEREHSFHYFSWLTFGPHFGTILAPFWDPRGPLFSPRGPKRGKKEVRTKFGVLFDPPF